MSDKSPVFSLFLGLGNLLFYLFELCTRLKSLNVDLSPDKLSLCNVNTHQLLFGENGAVLNRHKR